MEQLKSTGEGLKSLDQEALKTEIQQCFQDQDDQGKVMINLYRMVFPDWDKIKTIQGHPEVGNAIWKYICREFMAFDQEHHPKCFPGGAWISWGFSGDDRLKPWEISLKNCTVTYQN